MMAIAFGTKILIFLTLLQLSISECDRMFISNLDDPKNGTFTSPLLENKEQRSRQCIFTFVGAENERVMLSFSRFHLRGTPPDCTREYIDLYTELEEPNQNLIESPFGGRYCDRAIPRKRVSLYRTLVLGFYTDQPSVDETLFEGNYEFIDASPYVAGTPMPNQVCIFTIYSDQKREGPFVSPTYPGVYPKNLNCSYLFLGRKGQRVRIEFTDFDLFYGGSHCPFDYIKVYDGSNTSDPLINTYCGQKRNLAIYSSGENLLVQFITLQRTADGQNRGFSAWFEFSERFVNLGFIGKTDGEHIKGTECDQKILSHKESNGTVYSPNYPFLYHSNIVCKYYIYGLQDEQNLERVRLEFEKFEIPVPKSDLSECNNASVKIYLTTESFEEPDHVFCGAEAPPPVTSDGPVLVMVFSSGTSQGSGFKGIYSFETDYKVPGTPDPPGCCFKYLSSSSKQGKFNSPRHPSFYPASSKCEYDFVGLPGEQVEIVFNYFKFKSELGGATIGYNEVCTEDWIEIYEVHERGRELKIGRYCAISAPGPFLTDPGVYTVKIKFSTDDSGHASGFSASYSFLPGKTILGDCGENITATGNGLITSPRFPSPYEAQRQICNWFISVPPKHKILLYFEYFSIEGAMAERGCPAAVVRVWKDLSRPPLEICGESLTNTTRELISTTNMLKISFITAEKAVGSNGFKASWTQVKDKTECDLYRCPRSGYCISPEFKCNGIPNCGFHDKSDEANCIKVREVNEMMMIAMVSVGFILVIIILGSLCHRKRKRRRSTSNLGSQYEVSRCKPPHDLPPPGMPPYLSVESV